MRCSKRSSRAQAGFTLTELMIVSVVLVSLAGVIATTMSGLSSMTIQGSVRNQLQDMGERALSEILEDLRRSGWVEAEVGTFPFFFEDGAVTEEAFAHHQHEPPFRTSEEGEPEHGPSREIVFLLPQDEDLDRRPDVDPNTGELSWGSAQISYVLVPERRGHNVLERRTDGESPRPIAHFVERITFEDAALAGFRIPLKSLRVRIWLRKSDGDGIVHRHFVESVVQLRNGGIQGAPTR